MSAHPLKIVGMNEDGQPVVSIFEMVDSRGIDIEILIEELKKSNISISWSDYWDCAFKANYNLQRKLDELANIISFQYGKPYAEVWKQKSAAYISLLLSKNS
jgi:hypothetical protein